MLKSFTIATSLPFQNLTAINLIPVNYITGEIKRSYIMMHPFHLTMFDNLFKLIRNKLYYFIT